MNEKQKAQAAPIIIGGTASTGQGQTTAGAGTWNLVLEGTDENARIITRGRASVLGSLKAADPGLEARRARARTLYGEYRAKDPNTDRTTLCGMVAENFGVTPATVAEWVPNPTPTRRGRPKKK